MKVTTEAALIGKHVAGKLFALRSAKKTYRNVEVHITEAQLAEVLAMAAQIALDRHPAQPAAPTTPQTQEQMTDALKASINAVKKGGF